MRLFALVVAGAFALPTGAAAAPPVLQSVGNVSSHPTAVWSIPAGVTSQVVEAATRPDTASDGSFFRENVVVFDFLEEPDTSWTHERQLDPGTYYVHVEGRDVPCFYAGNCPVGEWSNILELVIPSAVAPPPPAPPPPALPPAPPPPPSAPLAPPAIVKLSITDHGVSPTRPKAGQAFAIAIGVQNAGRALGRVGTITCSARIGARSLIARFRAFTNNGPFPACGWRIPKSAGGKMLTASVGLGYKGAFIKRTLRKQIRFP
jgi:hypothetical protein